MNTKETHENPNSPSSAAAGSAHPHIKAIWRSGGLAHAIFLHDGTKITVGRDARRTQGPAWMQIGLAALITTQNAKLSDGHPR